MKPRSAMVSRSWCIKMWKSMRSNLKQLSSAKKILLEKKNRRKDVWSSLLWKYWKLDVIILKWFLCQSSDILCSLPAVDVNPLYPTIKVLEHCTNCPTHSRQYGHRTPSIGGKSKASAAAGQSSRLAELGSQHVSDATATQKARKLECSR